MGTTPLIALVTDFGTTDWYAACVKSVIWSVCPTARLLDLTHEIPPHDVLVGALTLSSVVPWLPQKTICVGVVDPGVGTNRAPIAASADGRFFVGPDNGLFSKVFDRAEHLTIVRLTQRRYWQSQVSSTFHGRDIFAPVAGHLARGRALHLFGSSVKTYRRLSWPSFQQTSTSVRGAVLHVDRFGNAITNIPEQLVARHPDGRVRCGPRKVRLVSTYGAGRVGELIAVIGSHGYLELALRERSAAARYRITRGDAVEFRW
ncbi:MAG: SAM-dependent chlorinase/fluorinase [Candidatus Omnitrophica bacterium]|nr:SAM-dependent chlorinase/fluorinase [Candidatus Omnitrophota bacterium]